MDATLEFHDKYCDEDYVPEDPTNAGDVQFAKKWNELRKFWVFEPIEPKLWEHCCACIDTRWVYTGLSSKFVFDYYLLLLKFTQIAINSYASSNKINGTASDIQSLLMEPNIYSDVCLLVCFHDGYFQENLQWMM